MNAKKLLVLITVISLSIPSVFSYDEISCSTDSIFSANGCWQCFDGWAKWKWNNIWLMSDDWVNSSSDSKILYKEEQEMPTMVNLSPSNVIWSQTPNWENFWEYTADFNNLYSEEDLWYVLNAWEKVNWLKSKLWYAYSLDKNSVPEWWNIGLLIYTIVTHDMTDWWATVSVDNNEHSECVLFKSWEASKTVIVTPEKPKRLPETWPEHVLLVILALILWFGLVRFTKRA